MAFPSVTTTPITITLTPPALPVRYALVRQGSQHWALTLQDGVLLYYERWADLPRPAFEALAAQLGEEKGMEQET